MSTYTQILYHLVFSTKYRKKTLSENNQDELYKYIWGILNKQKCHPYCINGVEDHIHIVTHIHPSVSLSDLIKDIKLASSKYIKGHNIFPNFDGWQGGYGGFTCSYKDKNRLVQYVKNQKDHHRIETFKEEFIELLNEHGVEFDEKYLL
jgi:REP element-mobilizing transposase RayT